MFTENKSSALQFCVVLKTVGLLRHLRTSVFKKVQKQALNYFSLMGQAAKMTISQS